MLGRSGSAIPWKDRAGWKVVAALVVSTALWGAPGRAAEGKDAAPRAEGSRETSVADASTGSGAVFRDPTTGMEFVLVRSDCFRMGDTLGDGDSDERPIHDVCLSEYYIGKYEVTQGEWEKVMGYNPAEFRRGDRYPVERVSWTDTQAFLAHLNRQSGKTYRLPTEAEWEYAARSGGASERYAGTSREPELADHAWYAKNASNSTHAVGEKMPNGLGLYDMSGNVWEWCQDFKGNYGSGAQRDPKGPSSGSARILRGGSWNFGPEQARAAIRAWSVPDNRLYNYGFRIVLPARD